MFSYDGKIVDENFLDQATHIIMNKMDDEIPKNVPASSVKVSQEIIWKCIKNKKKFQ